MCVIFILPSVFFSGFIFPRETMRWIFYALGAVLLATYYIELQRAIVLRGASLGDFWVNIVILAGMGLAVFSLCALQFKRKIALGFVQSDNNVFLPTFSLLCGGR